MFRDTLGCALRSDRLLSKRELKVCRAPRVRFHEVILFDGSKER